MIDSVLKKVLDNISLPKEEIKKLKKLAKNIVHRINKAGGNAQLGGSLAKGTMIKKEIQDIDIFVFFNSEEETKNLARILKKARLNSRLVHGSRDYFQLLFHNVIIEIIPVVKFSSPEEVKNVVDFSMNHVGYVKNKIAKKKKLVDEIKLAKVFCYANNCYGAESYISGFSGYALELLIIYFRSFVKFLKGIQKKRIIDVEKLFKNDKEILQELNESKLQSPVILIDPVYRYRNVCAGLSKETFNVFINATKKFLKNPSEKFFEKKIFDATQMKKEAKKKKAKFLELKLETDRQESNIAATKMKKFFKYLIKEFERKKQNVINYEFVYSGKQEANGYLVIKEKKKIEVKGPESKNKQAVKNFKRARGKIYEKNGFLWTMEKISVDEILEAARKVGEEMEVEFVIFKQ